MSARDNVVAQTQPPSLHGVNYLTGEYQFARAFFTNHTRQQHGSDGGKHTQLNFRLPESRAIGCDNDIARGHELTAAAKCRTVNQSDCWFRQLFEETKDRVERVEHLEDRFLNVILNRDAGAERATSLVCVEDDRHQLALHALTKCTGDFMHHRDAEDVQRRLRERDACDAIVDAESYVLVRVRHFTG